MPSNLFPLALVGTLALTLAGPGEAQRLTAGAGSEPTAVTKARVQEAFGELPLYFVEMAVLALPPGTITSIALVFDEGDDVGVGFVHLDNIRVGTSDPSIGSET